MMLAQHRSLQQHFLTSAIHKDEVSSWRFHLFVCFFVFIFFIIVTENTAHSRPRSLQILFRSKAYPAAITQYKHELLSEWCSQEALYHETRRESYLGCFWFTAEKVKKAADEHFCATDELNLQYVVIAATGLPL